jgi:hypothetical protein
MLCPSWPNGLGLLPDGSGAMLRRRPLPFQAGIRAPWPFCFLDLGCEVRCQHVEDGNLPISTAGFSLRPSRSFSVAHQRYRLLLPRMTAMIRRRWVGQMNKAIARL